MLPILQWMGKGATAYSGADDLQGVQPADEESIVVDSAPRIINDRYATFYAKDLKTGQRHQYELNSDLTKEQIERLLAGKPPIAALRKALRIPQ